MTKTLGLGVALLFLPLETAFAQYGEWAHMGSLWSLSAYPYSDMPFTSEAWFRPAAAGAAAFGWGRYATSYNGKTGDGNEVVINFGSPPSISWSSDGPGGVAAATPVLDHWYHVVATYSDGTSS
ncbi:MAG: hypothetical protein NTY19_17020 [Planctomycetota bacterium]|nr:hypothetical protein [Planctomycetota bacterium]